MARQSRRVGWLLDVFMMPRRADAAKVFEVTNPDILGLFGRQEATGNLFPILITIANHS